MAALAGCTGGDGDDETGDDGTGDGETGDDETGDDETGDDETGDEEFSREPNGDYTILTSARPQTFYPPEADDTGSGAVIGTVLDSSYGLTTANEVYPLLMDFQQSDSADVYVGTLRDNLEWGTDANGESYGSFTAEDVVFQYEFVDGVAGSEATDFWDEDVSPSSADVSAIENVEQTSELEYQVELVNPAPSFQFNPASWARNYLPKGLYEQYAPSAQDLRQSEEVQTFTYAGNVGAYDYVNDTSGQSGSVLFERSDEYYMRDHVSDSNVREMDEAWSNAPYFFTVLRDREGETATLNERWRAGEGDSLGLETDVVEEFRQRDDTRVEGTLGPFISFGFFNQRANGHPLVRTVEGRTAIADVIDKQTITQQIQRGLAGPPAVTHQPRWSEFYDDSQVTPRGLDVTEETVANARERIDGLSDFSVEESGDGFQTFGPDGEQVTLSLMHDPGSGNQPDIAAQITDDLSQLGIEIELLETANIISELATEPLEGEDPSDFPYNPAGPYNAGPPERTRVASGWDMLIGIGANSRPRNPGNTDVFWRPDGSVNAFGYRNDTITDLYDQAAESLDSAERREVFAEIFGILTEDSPAVFLSEDEDFTGFRPDINTGDAYNEFGFEPARITRFRQE
ncbi:hypothetical protein BRC62_01615 [Halobacteriales archaeon QH_10_67_13]|nr:MAG: hypothetical protein BRC62_01615 [Halobacteriales archaeon QH_10_67_13]